MKKWLTLLVALSVFSMAGTALAQKPKSGAASPNDAVCSAVENVVKATRADAAARSGDVNATSKIVEREFLPYTDFARTTRIAVGAAAWNQAAPEQRKQLVEQFQMLLVHTYALQLTQIRDQNVRFRFEPATLSAKGTDAVVKSRVQGSGDDMAVGYRLGKGQDGWRIYDIDMMGAWLIQIYQQQFASQIAQGGVEGLIQYLSAHNARFGQ
ncbi:MlaC/ttg2D family ABC transporter substrate-binding protein [Mycetohabitans endofungorum]|uniref:MlaC/ttg2D family ABC transporter substrate-binding protein n=1 Tax=Mycetohabitans endofungorum TaxID=417203 RepID=UPI002B052504|nr:ABC transporter substrate-binding protein [Mycetohabitans endofungorum]